MAELIGNTEEDIRDGVVGSLLVAAALTNMSKSDVFTLLEAVKCPPISFTRVEEIRKRMTGALSALEQGVITYNEFTDVLRDEISWWHTNGGI